MIQKENQITDESDEDAYKFEQNESNKKAEKNFQNKLYDYNNDQSEGEEN